MFKKIISLALVVTSVLSMAALLSSCDSHEHKYGAYTYDENEHWRPATCEHTELKDKVGPHEDADEDGKCDSCEYEMKTSADSGNNNDDNNNDNTNTKPTPKPTTITCTVTVVNASGAAVAGVEVKFLNDIQHTVPVATNDNGQVTKTLGITEGNPWKVMIVSVPDGYALDSTRYLFEDGAVTITLQAK